MRRLAFVICLLCAWLLPSFASAQRIVAETFMIPATDPGIQLHVRNKRLEGRDTFPPPSASCSRTRGDLPIGNDVRHAQGSCRVLGCRKDNLGSGEDPCSDASDPGGVGPGYPALHGARTVRQARQHAT